MKTTNPPGGHSAGTQGGGDRDFLGLFIGRPGRSRAVRGLDLGGGHYPVFPSPLASDEDSSEDVVLPSPSPMSQFTQMSIGTTTHLLLPLAPTEPIPRICLLPEAASKSSRSLPGATQSFTYFPRLAKELRLIIWELDADRILIATVQGTRSSKVPAAMDVCKESRKVGEKAREQMTIIRTDLKVVELWINNQHDIFYLKSRLPVIPKLRRDGHIPAFCGGEFPIQCTHGVWTTFLAPSWYRRLERVAIPLDEGFKRVANRVEYNTDHLWLTMLHLCPQLVRLTFVVRPHPEGTYQTPDELEPIILKLDEMNYIAGVEG